MGLRTSQLIAISLTSSVCVMSPCTLAGWSRRPWLERPSLRSAMNHEGSER
jgi:hypothetical protein